MEINNLMQANLYSVRQALGMATLRKTMNQDEQSMALLLDGMETASVKVMEQSVNPHLGKNIDIAI